VTGPGFRRGPTARVGGSAIDKDLVRDEVISGEKSMDVRRSRRALAGHRKTGAGAICFRSVRLIRGRFGVGHWAIVVMFKTETTAELLQ
jgi:hypothetical protein